MPVKSKWISRIPSRCARSPGNVLSRTGGMVRTISLLSQNIDVRRLADLLATEEREYQMELASSRTTPDERRAHLEQRFVEKHSASCLRSNACAQAVGVVFRRHRQ